MVQASINLKIFLKKLGKQEFLINEVPKNMGKLILIFLLWFVLRLFGEPKTSSQEVEYKKVKQLHIEIPNIKQIVISESTKRKFK